MQNFKCVSLPFCLLVCFFCKAKLMEDIWIWKNWWNVALLGPGICTYWFHVLLISRLLSTSVMSCYAAAALGVWRYVQRLSTACFNLTGSSDLLGLPAWKTVQKDLVATRRPGKDSRLLLAVSFLGSGQDVCLIWCGFTFLACTQCPPTIKIVELFSLPCACHFSECLSISCRCDMIWCTYSWGYDIIKCTHLCEYNLIHCFGSLDPFFAHFQIFVF